jgi:hypothetical protein
MTPKEYVDIYLSLGCYVGQAFTRVKVRNYLQDGKAPQSPRAKEALTKLKSAVAPLAGVAPGRTLPNVFTVSGDRYALPSLERVFMGKGAPDEIQDVIWLASLCGIVDETNVALYADINLGVDCGGLVANYYGMGHPTPDKPTATFATGVKPRTIWESKTRRRAASSIEVGDAAVFFQDVKGDNPDIKATLKSDGSYDTKTGSQAFHIGLVASKDLLPGGTMRLSIAESSGQARSNGNGVNVRALGTVTPIVANGLVYCMDGANRIYFTAEPSDASPSMPYW